MSLGSHLWSRADGKALLEPQLNGRPAGASGRFRAAEQAGRQEEQRLQKREDRLEGDPQQPERQRQEPDQGIEDQRQQGQRPADDEEEQPDEKLEHAARASFALWTYYASGGSKVAGGRMGASDCPARCINTTLVGSIPPCT